MFDLIRQNIVQLLMSAVEHNPPNLSQFMIGFDVKQSLSATTLQDPGEYCSVIVHGQDEIVKI